MLNSSCHPSRASLGNVHAGPEEHVLVGGDGVVGVGAAAVAELLHSLVQALAAILQGERVLGHDVESGPYLRLIRFCLQ